MDDWRSGLGYRLPDLPPAAPAASAGRSGDANVTLDPGYYSNYPNSNNPDWRNAQGQSSVHPHQNGVHSYQNPGPYYPHVNPTTEVPNGVGYPPYYNNHNYNYQYGQYGGYQYASYPYYPYTQHYQQQVPYQYPHHIPYHPEASHYVPATTNSATEPERRAAGLQEAANNSHIDTHSPVPADSRSAEADDDGWMSEIEEIDYSNGSVNVLNISHSDVPVGENQSQKQSTQSNTTSLDKETGSKETRIPLSVDVPQSTIPLNEVLSDLSQKSFDSLVSGKSNEESVAGKRTGTKRKRVTHEANNDEDDLAEFLGRTNRRVSARCYAVKASSRKEKDGDNESTSSLSDSKDKRARPAKVSVSAAPAKASGEEETGESIDNRRRLPETISLEAPEDTDYVASLQESVSHCSVGNPGGEDASLEVVPDDRVTHTCTIDNREESNILETVPMDTTVNCMDSRSLSFVNHVPIIESQLSENVDSSTRDCNNESDDDVLDIRIRTDIFEDEDDISDE